MSDGAEVTFEWAVSDQDDLLAQIRGLFNASLAFDDIIGFPGPLPDDGPSDYLEELRADLSASRKRILVGRTSDRTLIAMVVLRPNLLPNCRHVAEISKCVIHPTCRGRGMLALGLRYLLDHCRSVGIEVLMLDVRKGTRAESLWRALGFRQFGELQDYARTNGCSHAGVYLWAPVQDLINGAAQRADLTGSRVNPVGSLWSIP